MNRTKNFIHVSIVLLFLFFLIFLCFGFNKLLAYENPYADEEYYDEENDVAINAYVGGDAYNFIINSSRATAYFVLAGFSLLSAIALFILKEMKTFPAEVKSKQTAPEVINT